MARPLIKPKGGKGFGKPNLFQQSHEVSNTKLGEQKQNREAIQQILEVDDIYSISIFKSRVKFRGLQDKIRTGESNIMNFNYIWLVGIGIIMLLIAIIASIDSTAPLPVYIAMTIQEPAVDYNTTTDAISTTMIKWGLLVELFNVLKSCIFILWFFYSNNLTK